MSRTRWARRPAVLPAALVLLAAALALAEGAQAQQAERPPKPAGEAMQWLWPRAGPVPAIVREAPPAGVRGVGSTVVRAGRPGARGGVPVPEVEPNNTAGTATPVVVGDDAFGRIDPAADIDYWSVQLQAGRSVVIEVFASRIGSPLDSYLTLFDTDGTTVLAENDDLAAFVWDSRLVFTPPASGRYYIAIRDYYGDGGPDYVYQLEIREVPGDPTSLFASGLGAAWAAAAAPGNGFYVVDWNGRIVRVDGGQVSTHAANFVNPLGVALDGYGSLLVAHGSSVAAGSRDGRVTRVTAGGQRADIITGLRWVAAVAVGPNGDIWVADAVAGHIYRHTHGGARLDSINIAGSAGQFMELAFSPAGVLHFSDFADGVHRVVNGQVQRVITDFQGTGGIAFDRDGYLYVGSPWSGIQLYDPAYQPVSRPFAKHALEQTGYVLFGRDAGGGMTDRLFGVNLQDGTMREVNRAAVRAPGQRAGVDLLVIVTQSLRSAVMGAAYADTLRAELPGGTWRVAGGALPSGLTLSSAGIIAGVPEASGAFTLTVEVQTAGRIGSQNLTLQVSRPAVAAAAAAEHLMGVTGVLSEDQLRFLDLQGNRNGRFDIGDLRALLRAQPGPTAQHGRRP
jgi:sugar lactone lactonase YvrE